MRSTALLVVLVACEPEFSPEGEHHKYVVSSVKMPATPQEAPSLAIQLGNQRANAFGAALAGVVPLGLTTTTAIAHGQESLLLDVQTESFATSAAAGVTVDFGSPITPSPCTAPDSCGHHLTGGAKFSVELGSPHDTLVGTVRGGTFVGDATAFKIRLSFDGMRPIDVPFLTGGIELDNLSDDKIMLGVVGGGIARDVVMTQILPQISIAMSNLVSNDCVFVPPMQCNCKIGSPGEIADAAFDTNFDCVIVDDEVNKHPAIAALRTSDLSIGGVAAISFGMGITAVSATFP